MAARNTETLSAKKSLKHDNEAMPEPVAQGRPVLQRYQLQVDRQMKSTYATAEAAEKAGRAIKKAFPIVQVAIYDSAESSNTLIEA